jgi:mono/diheme cytochrome c family protein
MRTLLALLFGMALGVAAIATIGLTYIKSAGIGARGLDPGFVETTVARAARWYAIPQSVRTSPNPVSASADAIAEGMSHFADHCASCHANDGSGDTEMGRGFYPKAPDMRLPTTQGLSDGELFYIIENGIRFTGMPGWGTGTPAGEESTWRLVRFIRHLPGLTAAERDAMAALNPRSPEEIRQEIEEERFLNEGVTP